MRITLLTVGSRGDVQPFVALGRGLREAGHSVTLAAPLDFEGWISSQGLDYAPIRLDMRALSQSEVGQGWLLSGRNLPRAARYAIRAVQTLREATQEGGWAAVREGTDCFLYSTTTALMAGSHIAERLGVPSFQVSLQPLLTPTTAFAQPVVPPMPGWVPPSSRLARGYNWLTFIANQQVAWQSIARPTSQWRRNVLGLPPLPWHGPFRAEFQARHPFLHAYSAVVVPRPSDWPAWIHQTGYWFLDDDAAWQPPIELVRFLEAGPPPIVIGFGSMSDREPESLTARVVEALGRVGQRGLLITGWGGMHSAELPPTLFAIESVPHDWIFPRAAAVVHHGGAGTTAAGLRAGVPSIVVPFFADQFFWARRVAALGAGPEPVSFKQLTSERLAAALDRSLRDPAIKASAASLGEQLRKEDGVARAMEIIRQGMTGN